MPRRAHLGVEAVGLAEVLLAGAVVAADAREPGAPFGQLGLRPRRSDLLDQLRQPLEQSLCLGRGGGAFCARYSAQDPDRPELLPAETVGARQGERFLGGFPGGREVAASEVCLREPTLRRSFSFITV